MSYVNLVEIDCGTSQQEMFQRIRDFICSRDGTFDYLATGGDWILHDSSYATDEDTLTSGDYVIFYSPGEGGSDDIYVRMDYNGEAAVPHFYGYLSWNNSTHVGTLLYGHSGADGWVYAAAAVTYTLSIYMDLNMVTFIVENDTAADFPSGGSFGRTVDGPYNQEILTLASAYSAGSDVVITLPSVPSYGYEQWKNIYIRDDDHIEIIQIESISDNDITVDLVNSYSAGAKIQADHCYLVPVSQNFGSSTSTCSYALLSRLGWVGITSHTLNRLLNGSAHTEDRLQTLESYFAVDFVLGNEVGYAGLAGRCPNMYCLPYLDAGMTLGGLYVIRGTTYRLFKMKNVLYMLFKEV